MVRSILLYCRSCIDSIRSMLKKMIHQTRFLLPPLQPNLEGDVLLFDKPVGVTSFDLVAKVKYYLRREFNVKIKVGHAGTLDPMASGLMIICIGSFTKKIDSYQAQEKEYTGTITLGATTPGYDLEKEIDAVYPYDHITEEMLNDSVQTFIGDVEQIPPQYSAIKINGKRAYQYARENEEVEIQPKSVHISEFDLTRVALPDVDVRIVCSKGTYIRSIARDFGLSLNSGAYLTALRRVRIGEYRVEDAIKLLPEN